MHLPSWSRTRALVPVRPVLFFLSCGVATLGLSTSARAQHHYLQTNLVSDVSGLAPVTDPHLVNPWGLA